MIEEKGQEKRKQKKIEIIRGNSKDLNISNVKDSLIIEKPEENKKDNIVIPETVNSSDEQ